MSMISVQLTEEDAVSAHRLRTGGKWIITVLIPVVFFEAVAIWIGYQQYRNQGALNPELLGLVVALPIWLMVLHFVYEPWRTRRAFRNSPSLAMPHRVSWDDSALTLDGVDFMSRNKWDEFRGVRENSRLFMLSVSNGSVHIVPKRAFESADDAARFGEFARVKIAMR